MKVRLRRERRRRGERRGAVALELALVSVILIMFVIGMVELGRVIMVHQVLVNAAREGARRAIVPQATDAEVQDLVDGYMTSAGIQGHSRQISPSLAVAGSHQPLSVTVSVPHSSVSWGFAWIFTGDTLYSETVTMRRE